MKLTEILVEGRRLNPAIITMKRGTIIEVDHARWIRYPSGSTYLVAGIGPPTEHHIDARPAASGGGFVRHLRDFWARGEYIPAVWQDETGWHQPGDENERAAPHMNASGPISEYSAHRAWKQHCRFTRILTMNPDNIESIDWVNER